LSSWNDRFFWHYIVPSAIAGGIWAALPLPVPVLVFFVLVLAAGQIWNLRAQLLDMLFRWLAIPVISLSIVAIGGCFAFLGYALVLTIRWNGLGPN
jgi:hypothetical protein